MALSSRQRVYRQPIVLSLGTLELQEVALGVEAKSRRASSGTGSLKDDRDDLGAALTHQQSDEVKS